MKSLIPWQKGQKHAAPVRSDDWFGRWWEDRGGNFFPALKNSYSNHLPSVDVTEDKKEVKVRAEIPGMDQKDIELTWHDGILKIQGEKKNEKEEKSKDRYYRECSYGSFSREIEIGRNVNWEKAIAKYKNGVLTVSMPKTGASQKLIDVHID
jgi:HSP20 family protein